MASNAVVFFAGVGTTFVILTAGFSSGLVFTKAAFDDTRAATRADPRPPPSVRVILPDYGEPAPSAIPVSDQPQTEATLATPEAQTVREAPTPAAHVSAPDPRTVERNLRVERRKQAERQESAALNDNQPAEGNSAATSHHQNPFPRASGDIRRRAQHEGE